MAKKTLAKKVTAPAIELNQWCIEMAMRWPVHSEHSYGGSVGGMGGYVPGKHQDEDVIGRATKIREWVTSAAAK